MVTSVALDDPLEAAIALMRERAVHRLADVSEEPPDR